MYSMESSIDLVQIAISGLKGSGKTSFLLALWEALEDEGLSVSGILSPAVYDGRRKVAIEMVDLESGDRRVLARLAADVETPVDLCFGDWAFFTETITWGNECLSKIESTDVLILDEIGPLELELGQGLQAGLDQLTGGRYRLGVMTVRPKCVNQLVTKFPGTKVYSLISWQRDALIKEILRIVLA